MNFPSDIWVELYCLEVNHMHDGWMVSSTQGLVYVLLFD